MKSIIARPTLVAVSICLLVGLTATRLHAGEYFIYQDPSQQMEPKPWERTDLLQSARQDDPLGGASWLVCMSD